MDVVEGGQINGWISSSWQGGQLPGYYPTYLMPKIGKFAFDKLGIFVSKHPIMHLYMPAMGDQHGNKGEVFKIVASL